MIPKLPKGFTHPMAIGEGVFSSVFRVRQDSLDRWVAVKILKEKNREKRVEQLKEARTQANMQIGCVPEVFDVFEWNKQVFIVMQHIKGVRLTALLNENPSEEQRFWLAEGILQATATLHSHGYAHRDLKPDNILVSPKHGIFMVDFGLSKDIMESFETAVGIVKGTPAYMAPELWLGKGNVDYFRADVYAVGRILKSVLHDCPAVAVTEALLSEDPEARPADGSEALKLWNRQSGFNRTSPDWERLAGRSASDLLARSLFNAAKKLRHAGREEEAYWLLSECLEENPNFSEALELMGRFSPDSRKLRKRLAIKTGFVSALAIFLLLSFFLGRQKGKLESKVVLAGSNKVKQGKLFLSLPALRKTREEVLPLRMDSLHIHSLSARLVIQDPPAGGLLAVNEQILEPGKNPDGWKLPFGRHVVSWRDEQGNVRWKENVELLPFQTKVIRFPLQPEQKKG
jgi:serine/threonine protein kinase